MTPAQKWELLKIVAGYVGAVGGLFLAVGLIKLVEFVRDPEAINAVIAKWRGDA
jgi:hypothetical protein